ncbi:efflux RND transporter periplasmic adaptor subunit [Cerasicoccus fimbriatus]|uniref:efflux RND transporter periplasmic adaptor subunit n=1 Tax=Cerasicoccus fimbriatus TaxID=3014554 RepID=UPI0022B4F4CE|nr:efflux RND transporter periplasmic adaptor subunit [Cerasicoccus sp. TK19100]
MTACLGLWVTGCGPEPIQPKGPPPRTVTALPVTTGNVPLYLDTLGRATAFESVDIVSQVDGKITGVHFTQGAMLKEGDLMFTIFKPPYEAAVMEAEGQVKQAKSQLAINELNLERNRPLVPEKLISEQDYQSLEATVEANRGALQQAEGELINAKVNLGYTDITSPIDGMASVYLVDIGNVVSAAQGKTLATVLRMDPIYVDFIAPEKKFEEVRQYFNEAGGELEIVASYLASPDKKRTGRLTILGNEVDTETGTVNLRATFENADGFLWPNQPLGVRVILKELKDAVLAPSQCVGIGQNGRYVFVIDEANGIVHLKNVEVGQTQDDGTVVIKSGVKPGDKLVGEGLNFLRDGMEIVVVDGNPADVKLPPSLIQPVVDMLKKYKKATPEEIKQIEDSRRLPPKLLKALKEHGVLTEKEENYLLNLETGSPTGEPQKGKAQSGSSEGDSK